MEGDDSIGYSGVAARHGMASPRHCLDSPCIDIPSPSPPTVSPSTLSALYRSARGHHFAISITRTSNRRP